MKAERKPIRIDVVLENCEFFAFSAESVALWLDGLNKHIFGTTTYNNVSHTALVIEDTVKVLENGTCDGEDWKTRIDKDITQIEIRFDNGDTERYFVDWCNKSDYENKYETDIKEPFRHIYIISRCRQELEDF